MPIPFQSDDLYLYQTINEVSCASSVDIAACTVESVDRDQDVRFSAIWAVPLNKGQPWQLTTGASTENTPRWSPDGSQLAFVSSRAGTLQIYLLNRLGGEAQRLGMLPGAVQTVEWSPAGNEILAICSLMVDPDLCGQRKQHDLTRPTDAPKRAWRLPFKQDGTGFILDTEKHLFVVEVATGNFRQLTDGPFTVKSAVWSPDGLQVAYTRTRESPLAHRTDIWLLNADGSNNRLIVSDIANTQYPRWSPDGSKIVFSGSYHDGDAQTRLWLYDIKAGALHGLGHDGLEVVSGDTVQWSHDSSEVYFVLAWRGRQLVASVRVADGSVRHHVSGDRQVDHLAISAHQLVFVSEDPAHPNEIFCANFDGSNERKLSNFNPWWSERTLPHFEMRSFVVPDGEGGEETIEGWLLKPQVGRGPYPLLVDVHGGPASYAYVKYNWHRYRYVLVSQGWAVLALNPVGSSSFGRDFCNRLRGRWGENDLPQHLAAVASLQKEGIADDRLAMAGKSYGGFMSAWALGHSSLFKAIVVSAPVSNLEVHFGTSDSGYYSDPYAMDEEPPQGESRYRSLSPIRHLESADTPTLILQGEADERCPKSQAEELFTILRYKTELPVEMVLYPNGSHHFFETGKPSHCLHAVNALVNWLNRWIAYEKVERK